MRSWWTVGLAMLMVPLAGCVVDADGDGAYGKPDEGDSGGAVLDIEPLVMSEADEDWSSIAFHVDADAGEWITVVHPVPADLDPAWSYDIQIRLEATANETIDWVWHPLRRVSGLGGSPFRLVANVLGHADGPTHHLSDTGSDMFSIGPGDEFFFVFAADAKWSMDFVIKTNRTGDASLPDFIGQGDGALFGWGEEADSLLFGPVVELEVDEVLEEAGWTEVRAIRQGQISISADVLTLTLADGSESSRTFGPRVVRDDRILSTSVGTTEMDAGKMHGRLVRASNEADVSLAFFHIPIDESAFPEGYTWSAGYAYECDYVETDSSWRSTCYLKGNVPGPIAVTDTWNSEAAEQIAPPDPPLRSGG